MDRRIAKFKAHPSFSPTKQQQCVLPHIVQKDIVSSFIQLAQKVP